MLADQQRYDFDDMEAGAGRTGGKFESGDVTLTEDNVDDFVNYINTLSNG